jgi:hypothetical protein
MAHVKAFYRRLNGKTVYVPGHDTKAPQGRPAEIHERTALGKHKTGSYYLRATDAEDGKHIEATAKAQGVPIQAKLRQGAVHFGREGAYDHYHFGRLEDAAKVHTHLKEDEDEHGAPTEPVVVVPATPFDKGHKIPPRPQAEPTPQDDANRQAQIQHIEGQKGKVGGDKVALAALEMRKKKLEKK